MDEIGKVCLFLLNMSIKSYFFKTQFYLMEQTDLSTCIYVYQPMVPLIKAANRKHKVGQPKEKGRERNDCWAKPMSVLKRKQNPWSR